MTTSSVTIAISDLRVGDSIVESTKSKPTKVTSVEFKACSDRKTHVNEKDCYESFAFVNIVPR